MIVIPLSIIAHLDLKIKGFM